MKKTIYLLTAIAAFLTFSSFVPQYGQCGGTGYNGETVCAPNSICTYTNDFYSQCLPCFGNCEPSGAGRISKPYTATCSGRVTTKTTTYKDVNGNITGTVKSNMFSVSGSAGAGAVSSTSVEKVENYSFTASGNSCPSGQGTCTPYNPCLS